jgi:hypothetical protein
MQIAQMFVFVFDLDGELMIVQTILSGSNLIHNKNPCYLMAARV